MKCKNCGYQNPNGAKFCGYCQHKMNNNAERNRFLIAGVLFLIAGMILFFTFSAREKSLETEPTVASATVENTEYESLTIATESADAEKEEHPFLVEKLQYPETIDPALITGGNAWTVAYYEKMQDILKNEWTEDRAEGILKDIDEDDVPELILYHNADLPQSGVADDPAPYYVYSIFDYENGKLVPIIEKERLWIMATGEWGYVGIVYCEQKPLLMVMHGEETYGSGYDRIEDTTYKLYDMETSEVVDSIRLVDTYQENGEESGWTTKCYVNGLSIKRKGLEQLLDKFSNLHVITDEYGRTRLTFNNQDSIPFNWLQKQLLEKMGMGDDSMSWEEVHISDLEPYDIFRFGTYEQDNDLSNGPEKIEWIVLESIWPPQYVAISRYALDCQQYADNNHLNWSDSSIRRWLNHSFYEKAFSAEEQERILEGEIIKTSNQIYSTECNDETMDKIFLLSTEQAQGGFCSRVGQQCKATPYAKAQGVNTDPMTGNCEWILRTPGKNDGYVSYVDQTGDIRYEGVEIDNQRVGIRPVLWLNAMD